MCSCDNRSIFHGYAPDSGSDTGSFSISRTSSAVSSSNPLFGTSLSSTGNIAGDRLLVQVISAIQQMQGVLLQQGFVTQSLIKNCCDGKMHGGGAQNQNPVYRVLETSVETTVQIKPEYVAYILKFGMPSDGIFLPDLLASLTP